MHTKLSIYLLLAATVGLFALACSSESGQEENAAAFGQDIADVKLDGQPVILAGIKFTPPGDWTDLGPSGMRKASYTYGPVDGDVDSATVTVFYFGAGQGGDVNANIKRWLGQMTNPKTGQPRTTGNTREITVNGMTLTMVDVSGDYVSSMGGPMMAGNAEEKKGYYMSAAVLEGPEGNVFFKLTGPEKTAKAMDRGFMAMLAQVQPAG